MDKLQTFLRDAARKDYRLGQWDCGLWVADWYIAATGKPDPAAHLRGARYTEAELARHMRRIIKGLGLKRTSEPRAGDIGIAVVRRRHIVGAIFTGNWWVVLTNERGIGGIPPKCLRFIAAWRLE